METNLISGIYTITNTINGKVYVGLSKNMAQRKSRHFTALQSGKHANGYLQNEYIKYGKQHFDFEVIEFCAEEYMASQENYWSNMLMATNRVFGYNIEPTNPNKNNVISNETRLKISKAIKGRYLGRVVSVETRVKMSASRVGKIATKEHRENISISQKGRKMPQYQKDLLMKYHLGRVTTDKQKVLLRQNSVTRKPILQYNKDGVFLKEYMSIKQATLESGVSRNAIRSSFLQKRKSNKYIWRIKNENI